MEYGCLAVPQQDEDMDKQRISDDTLAGDKWLQMVTDKVACHAM